MSQVQGQAQIGDVVFYFDIVNQHGETYQVIGMPETKVIQVGTPPEDLELPSNGYKLVGLESGKYHWSDLRQAGWSFI